MRIGHRWSGVHRKSPVDRLVDQSHEVLVVDDLSTGHADNLAPARARGG